MAFGAPQQGSPFGQQGNSTGPFARPAAQQYNSNAFQQVRRQPQWRTTPAPRGGYSAYAPGNAQSTPTQSQGQPYGNAAFAGASVYTTPAISTTNPGYAVGNDGNPTRDLANAGNAAPSTQAPAATTGLAGQNVDSLSAMMNQRAAALAQVLDQGKVYAAANGTNQNIGAPQYDRNSIIGNANAMVQAGWQNPLGNVAGFQEPAAAPTPSPLTGMQDPQGFMSQLLGLIGQQEAPSQRAFGRPDDGGGQGYGQQMGYGYPDNYGPPPRQRGYRQQMGYGGGYDPRMGYGYPEMPGQDFGGEYGYRPQVGYGVQQRNWGSQFAPRGGYPQANPDDPPVRIMDGLANTPPPPSSPGVQGRPDNRMAIQDLFAKNNVQAPQGFLDQLIGLLGGSAPQTQMPPSPSVAAPPPTANPTTPLTVPGQAQPIATPSPGTPYSPASAPAQTTNPADDNRQRHRATAIDMAAKRTAKANALRASGIRGWQQAIMRSRSAMV